MNIEEQIRIAENRTKLIKLLYLISDEYGLTDVDAILKPNKNMSAIESRQVFIAVCYYKLLFTQSDIANMVGLSQPHTYRNLMLFNEGLEFDSEAKEIYQKIVNKLELS